MAIMIEEPYDLAFKLYGIPWPDVDEDKVGDFGENFDKLCEATADFGRAVDGLLTVLADNAESKAFTAVTAQWRLVSDREMYPVVEGIGDAVREGATIAKNMLTSYKATLIGVLIYNVGSDVVLALAAPGPGTAAVIAGAAAKKIVLRLVMEEVREQFQQWVIQGLDHVFDFLVFDPLSRIAGHLRDEFVANVARDVTSNSAVRRGTLRTAGALYVDFADVITATKNLAQAADGVKSAFDTYLGTAESEELSAPDYRALIDMTLREAVRSALLWALREFVRLLSDIVTTIVDDLIRLIVDTYEAYVSADKELATHARALRESFHMRPTPPPFIVDRSARPQLIKVWDDPPAEIFTGEAVSAARFDITVIDLPDDSDPVITGPAQSDARDQIRKIVLPDLTPPEKEDTVA